LDRDRSNPDAPRAWFEKVIDNAIKDRGRGEARRRRILAAMAAEQIAAERAAYPKRTDLFSFAARVGAAEWRLISAKKADLTNVKIGCLAASLFSENATL